MVGLSQGEFARRIGTSRTSVSRWIKSGKISTNKDGTLAPQLLPLGRRLAAGDSSAPASTPAAPRSGGTKDDLVAEQVRERRAKADLAELDAAVRRGELVAKVEVVADARAAMERIRAALLAIAPRVALQLEAQTGVPAPQAEALVADEVNAALEALHATRFGGEP